MCKKRDWKSSILGHLSHIFMRTLCITQWKFTNLQQPTMKTLSNTKPLCTLFQIAFSTHYGIEMRGQTSQKCLCFCPHINPIMLWALNRDVNCKECYWPLVKHSFSFVQISPWSRKNYNFLRGKKCKLIGIHKFGTRCIVNVIKILDGNN